MTAKNIVGFIILALNLAGICFMAIMILTGLRNKSANNSMVSDKGMVKKKSKSDKKQPLKSTAFNKGDYLLDDIDLSQFDDLDLDLDHNPKKN